MLVYSRLNQSSKTLWNFYMWNGLSIMPHKNKRCTFQVKSWVRFQKMVLHARKKCRSPGRHLPGAVESGTSHRPRPSSAHRPCPASSGMPVLWPWASATLTALSGPQVDGGVSGGHRVVAVSLSPVHQHHGLIRMEWRPNFIEINTAKIDLTKLFQISQIQEIILLDKSSFLKNVCFFHVFIKIVMFT